MIDKIIDFSSNEFHQNPYLFYDELRKYGNIHFSKKENFWLIIGYEEILEILKNYNDFSSVVKNPFDPYLLHNDPPIHNKNKQFLIDKNGFFNIKNIINYEMFFNKICEDVFDSLNNKNEFDVINDFANSYSIKLISNYLGIPLNISGLIDNWVSCFLKVADADNRIMANNLWNEIEIKLTEYITSKLEIDAKDRLTKMYLDSKQNGMTIVEFVGILKSILMGGSETTPTLISSTIYYINCYNLQSKIDNEFNLVNIISEVLRFDTPIQMIGRVAKEEVKFRNYLIKKDAKFKLALGAGNRDSSVFENPNQFNWQKDRKKILSFGAGVHYCLGSHFSLLATKVAINFLYGKADYKIKDNIYYKNSIVFRKIKSLKLSAT